MPSGGLLNFLSLSPILQADKGNFINTSFKRLLFSLKEVQLQLNYDA
jgi:hypothetical protein